MAECIYCGAIFKQDNESHIACSVCSKEFCEECACPSYMCSCKENFYRDLTGKDLYIKPIAL